MKKEETHTKEEGKRKKPDVSTLGQRKTKISDTEKDEESPKKPKTNQKEIVVEIKDLYKSFGDNHVLQGLNLKVYKGESLVVLGKSGTGKSVLIKCMIGLEDADKGSIEIFGQDVNKMHEKELNELRVRIGFLFQSGALYDSMTIEENLAFPLKRHKKELEENEVSEKISSALEDVDLHEVQQLMPSELSGGMKKRVAVARTLILEPELMLYDEPTTGLDTITSKGISELIIDMQKKNKMTSIIITHDMNCAKLTADRIVILKEGNVAAEGTYDELERSDDEWVRSFFEN